MPCKTQYLSSLVLICLFLELMNVATGQVLEADIPLQQRATNSPTTVFAEPNLIDIPQFIVDPFWPKPLPNNWLIGQVSGVHVDTNDNIWVIQRPKSLTERDMGAMLTPPISKCCFPAPPVLQFDQSGNLLRAWGGPGEGFDWPRSEHGIHIANGFVWLAGNSEGDNQILKFTIDGEFVMQIGTPDASSGSNDTENLNRPADLFVDIEASEVYVADGYGNRRIIVFDTDTGNYKRHWGAYGNIPNDEDIPAYDPSASPSQQFSNPVHCVEISTEGYVYVCDRTNNRLQIFKKDGSFISEVIYEPDTLLNGSVYDIAFSLDSEQKLIFMVDGMNNELRIIDRISNITRARIGRTGRSAGQFYSVHDVTIDSQGNLYTTEVQTGQRVQKFRRLSQ